GLVSAFATLPYDVDFMVIDTASGIGRGVSTFCQAADEVLVVVCDEPSSLTDAYALIKVLSRDRGVRDFRVLCNNVRNAAHGETLFRTLLRACDRFLDVRLDYFGMVPADEAVKRAVRRQQAVVECYPGSPAGRAFKELARRADNGEVPVDVPGRPAFFLERRVAGGRALGARTDASAMYASEAAQQGELLIERYMDLVRRIAYHMLGRLPASVQVEDLIQAGVIGLLEAGRQYDSSHGASFETYAGIRIRGAILDEVRRQDWG